MLKFRDYWLHKDRNETHVALILREAAAEVFTHNSEAPMPEPVYIWRAGLVDLDVCPLYKMEGRL